MSKRSRTVISLIVTAALFLAACGGGDDKPQGRPTLPLPTATKEELARLKQGNTGANKDIIGTPAVAKLTPEAAEKPSKPAPSSPAAAPKPNTTKPGQMLLPAAGGGEEALAPTPRPKATPLPTRTPKPGSSTAPADPAAPAAPKPTNTPVPTRTPVPSQPAQQAAATKTPTKTPAKTPTKVPTPTRTPTPRP